MLAGSLGAALVLWNGTQEVLRQRLSVGELVMFVSYLALFYVPINQIHSVNHMLQHALAASERVFEVLDIVPEVKDRAGTSRLPVPRSREKSNSEVCSFIIVLMRRFYATCRISVPRGRASGSRRPERRREKYDP